MLCFYFLISDKTKSHDFPSNWYGIVGSFVKPFAIVSVVVLYLPVIFLFCLFLFMQPGTTHICHHCWTIQKKRKETCTSADMSSYCCLHICFPVVFGCVSVSVKTIARCFIELWQCVCVCERVRGGEIINSSLEGVNWPKQEGSEVLSTIKCALLCTSLSCYLNCRCFVLLICFMLDLFWLLPSTWLTNVIFCSICSEYAVCILIGCYKK